MIRAARVARMATADAGGQPHVLPVVFAYDGQRLFTPLDGKPKRVDHLQLQRVRNISANHHVALVIDHYSEDWQQLAWVQLRGQASLLAEGALYDSGMALLRDKYPQYAVTPLHGRPLILIEQLHIRSWRAAIAAEHNS
jgi:PPOX class probable F420-dependent enzyme